MNPVEMFFRMNQSPSAVNPSQLKLLAKSFESPAGEAVVYDRVPTYCCAFASAIGAARRERRASVQVTRRRPARPTLCTSTNDLIVVLRCSDTVTDQTPG